MHQNSEATLSISNTMKTDSKIMRQDSSLMRRDSSRMAMIAWIGIILLPTSLVATIISAVYQAGESARKMTMKIGILFAISIPVTVVFAVWFKKYVEPRSLRV